jgi:cytoskeletal protein CcmA (bactofilin family)
MSKNATFSMIGADVVITGDISASADLHIDGQVRGDVSCLALVQGATSEMVGTIVAQSAHVAGTVRGSIVVGSLVIQRSAHFVGDAHYETLTVEQGARVEGTFAMGGAERPATAAPSVDAPPLPGDGEAEQATDG